MDFAIFIALALVFGAFALIYGQYDKKRRLATYQKIAEHLGGDATGDRVRATMRGVLVTLDRYTTGSGDSSVTWDRATVYLSDNHSRTLEVYKETAVFSAIGKALGGQDVIIGEPTFDDMFIIKASEPYWAKEVLTDPVRQLHLQYAMFRLEVEGIKLTTVRKGGTNDINQLIALMDLAALYAIYCDRSMLQNQLPSGHEPEQPHNAW